MKEIRIEYDVEAHENDNTLPSIEMDMFWFHASGNRKQTKITQNRKKNYVGKWLIFTNTNSVDALWKSIKKATKDQILGIESKVSTAKPKDPRIGYRKGRHVICVYTYDWRDKEDVIRVREELRKLGVIHKIYYKPDEATNEGKYAAKGNKGISMYAE